MKCVLGTKVGMTQVFSEDGAVVPCTLIKIDPCYVIQKKTQENDGYRALVLACGSSKRCHPSVRGQARNVKECSTPRYVAEFRCSEEEMTDIAVGAKYDASVFQAGDEISVRGVSKGKGFAGVVKRYRFAGAPASHGRKHDLRKGGSIGCAYPEHVLKGRKMAGRMGHNQTTLHSVPVVNVDAKSGLMAVKGAVPGAKGTLIQCFEDRSSSF